MEIHREFTVKSASLQSLLKYYDDEMSLLRAAAATIRHPMPRLSSLRAELAALLRDFFTSRSPVHLLIQISTHLKCEILSRKVSTRKKNTRISSDN